MADQPKRPETAQVISDYKSALVIARGQDFADNTTVEYSRGWFSAVCPDGASFKYRLAQIEAITQDLKNGRTQDLKSVRTQVLTNERTQVLTHGPKLAPKTKLAITVIIISSIVLLTTLLSFLSNRDLGEVWGIMLLSYAFAYGTYHLILWFTIASGEGELTGKIAGTVSGLGVVLMAVGMVIVTPLSETYSANRGSVSGTPDAEKMPKYCIWPGCTKPPSEFWADKTGYCKEHVEKALELQKLDEKSRKQGF